MSDFTKFKEDINRTLVTGGMLGDVTKAYAAMPTEECSVFENRINCVLALLTEKGYGTESIQLAMAITIRLMALDAILADQVVERWTIPGREPDIMYLHSDLLRAAAEEPILEGPQGQPLFNAETFRRKLLEIVTARGHS